jgi:hypothetical protein
MRVSLIILNESRPPSFSWVGLLEILKFGRNGDASFFVRRSSEVCLVATEAEHCAHPGPSIQFVYMVGQKEWRSGGVRLRELLLFLLRPTIMHSFA